jgi:GTP-binding protein
MIIRKATYVISSPDVASCPKADKPEYAFIGRSNVGKSSLINMLTDIKNLAKTSATPGKTQLINHFVVDSKAGEKSPALNWYLVDLPGYGFAKVSASQRKRWEKMIEGYLRTRETLVNTFILVDSRHEPQQLDLEFVNQLGAWGIPFSIVFTKADKETQKVVSANVKKFSEALLATWEELPPIYITSAEKKSGRKAILAAISDMNESYQEMSKRTQG